MPISVAFFNFGIIWNMCHICRFPILTNIFSDQATWLSGCSRVVLALCHKRNASKTVSRTVIGVRLWRKFIILESDPLRSISESFFDGEWQFLVNTPSLPHCEQNFFSRCLYSKRVCPRCLQRQAFVAFVNRGNAGSFARDFSSFSFRFFQCHHSQFTVSRLRSYMV